MKYAFLLLFTVFPILWGTTATAQSVDVAELQRALAALGYQPGPVNGEWGVETRGALFQFQRDNGFGTSLDIGPEQLQLLGMAAPAAAASTFAAINLEPDSATPIVGDLDATMQLYGQLASHIIFKSFRDQARATIVTSASNPAEISLLPPDPGSLYANIFAFNGTSFEASGIHISATKLRYRAGAAPDLAVFTSPGSEAPAPDSLCDDAAPGAERTHICIVSGQIAFGGTFRLGDNIVSCREGTLTVTNANRDQVFASGSICSVNGNPVRLSDTGWTEDPA
jgi:peptidoglycan hydrolase-like protein with peptidoglycan-binding domain